MNKKISYNKGNTIVVILLVILGVFIIWVLVGGSKSSPTFKKSNMTIEPMTNPVQMKRVSSPLDIN